MHVKNTEKVNKKRYSSVADALGTLILLIDRRVIAAKFPLGDTSLVFVSDLSDIHSTGNNYLHHLNQWVEEEVKPFPHRLFRVPPEFFNLIYYKIDLPEALRLVVRREIQLQHLKPENYQWAVDEETLC